MTRKPAFESDRLREIYLISFLMANTVRYSSFTSPEPFRKMNSNDLARFVLMSMFVAYPPSIALSLIGLTYVLSGPYSAVCNYLRAKNEGAETLETEYQETETR